MTTAQDPTTASATPAADLRRDLDRLRRQLAYSLHHNAGRNAAEWQRRITATEERLAATGSSNDDGECSP